MKIKQLFAFLIVLVVVSCNPYKGFKGVSKKGMKTNVTPSQQLRNDYDSKGKKMKRSYKRELKRKKKRLGTKSS